MSVSVVAFHFISNTLSKHTYTYTSQFFGSFPTLWLAYSYQLTVGKSLKKCKKKKKSLVNSIVGWERNHTDLCEGISPELYRSSRQNVVQMKT